ncbi:MarR family winged helix-turn-helix transcriptional regulator [Rhizobium sp. L1K21]|uniref:MarR family winged helix-turn-helix transcriptional regulator n=1 Tax=Rhizobium sp. L1K21 TaxID=2954933 RepID=UPI00209238AD|nr:MarR family transcriptional regulator [Rhizobium sp. L1K21]MCO6185015.1 MarR family transcriptional regulator [Rhizobium sp. L1K21]
MAKKDGKKNKDKKKDKVEGEVAASSATVDASEAIIQVSRSLRTLISRELSGIGLYAGQEGVILSLAETDGLTAGTIADRVGVKPPTMTRTIVRMEAQGFVERRDGDDGRLTTVWLTEAGRQTVARINEVRDQVQNSAMAGLSEKQQRNLAKYLKAVDANLLAALGGC